MQGYKVSETFFIYEYTRLNFIKLQELSHVSDNYERLKQDRDKLVLEIDNLKSQIESVIKSEKESIEKMEKLRYKRGLLTNAFIAS